MNDYYTSLMQTDARQRAGSDLLNGLGLGIETEPPSSTASFEDGAHFRIEIPSVEGPAAFQAVLEAATDHQLTVNRVSQGSGGMLLTAAEIREMVAIGVDAGIEVCLFVGPRQAWSTGVAPRSAGGAALAGAARGLRQLRSSVDDIYRSVDLGIRSFLISDLGLLSVVTQAQRDGSIPPEVIWKTSVVIAPSNAAGLLLFCDLGATTINVPTDVSGWELAEMRAVTDRPLDLYLEAPDDLGGIVRGEEVASFVRIGSPLYAKFGLRNAPALYPSGLHLRQVACDSARERVRRAALALEWMAVNGPELRQSESGAVGLALPVR